jgi:hypothetical protein
MYIYLYIYVYIYIHAYISWCSANVPELSIERGLCKSKNKWRWGDATSKRRRDGISMNLMVRWKGNPRRIVCFAIWSKKLRFIFICDTRLLFDAPCAPAFDRGRLEFISKYRTDTATSIQQPYSYWDGICQSAMLVMFERLSSVVMYV